VIVRNDCFNRYEASFTSARAQLLLKYHIATASMTLRQVYHRVALGKGDEPCRKYGLNWAEMSQNLG
jgi:hypothetical protein